MKFKVALGYLISLLIIITIAIIAYRSLNTIINSIETLSKPKEDTNLVKRIINGISEIRSNTRFYSVTVDSVHYNKYLQNRKTVKKQIDSLLLSNQKLEDLKSLKNLNTSFNEYIYSLDKWLNFKTKTQVNEYERLISKLEKNAQSLELRQNNAPQSKIKTTKKVIEKSILSNKYTIEEIEKKKSILEKLLGKKSKKNETKIVNLPNDTIRKEVLTEIKTEIVVDSNYYKKVDIILEQMQEMILEQNLKKQNRNLKLEKMEKKLIEDQDILVDKINEILQYVNNQNTNRTKAKINEVKLDAQKGYQNLLIIGVIGFVISFLFVIAIFNDISKSNYYKKQLEDSKNEALYLAKVKEDFLSNMSHELRSPLTSIIGFIENINNNSNNSNNTRYLQMIADSSEHLLSIVNDILDYAKLESGELKFKLIGFNPIELINEIIHTIKPKVEKKNLNIYFKNLLNKELIIKSDPFRLKQVLFNIIENSIKFTEKGHISIQLYEIDNYIEIAISDTGIGIDNKKNKEIFKEFKQANNEITQKYGGTGLGLAISKKIISNIGGNIYFESTLNKGTTFHIKIPIVKVTENEYNTINETVVNINNELVNKQIIVIDDDILVHYILSPIFEKWGIHSNYCTDYQSALKLLNKNNFDLIILDYRLKNEDALSIINKIKNCKNIQNQQIPIILCTANVRVDTKKLLQLLNGGKILFKPFKQVDLGISIFESLNIPLKYSNVKKNIQTNIYQYSLDDFKSFALNDTETLKLFINSFINQTKTELEEIDTCFKNNNYNQIIEIAHRMINTCSQLKANSIIELLTKIELLENKSFDPNEIHILILELFNEVNKLNNALEMELTKI